jgi:hypothetical protein
MWFNKRKQDGITDAKETVDPQTGVIVSSVKSKEERAFVRRLDLFLMTYGCLSQVIKYLGKSLSDLRFLNDNWITESDPLHARADQTNISSACMSLKRWLHRSSTKVLIPINR